MSKAEIIDGAGDAAIAAWLAQRIHAALGESGSDAGVALALPGGSTPFPILRHLLGEQLDWHRLEVWPTDDRLVPEDHPASNAGRLRALLEPAGARLVPLAEGLVPPPFALVWLGMGEDGHIASLFPNTDPQVDDPALLRRLTPDPLPPEAPFDRLTLTLPALLRAQELVLVARGEAKRRVLEAAMAGQSDLPIARLLAAARQPVTCFT